MIAIRSRLLLLCSPYVAFAAKLVSLPTNMSTYFALHWVVGRCAVTINTDSRGLAMFILNANRIGVCVSDTNDQLGVSLNGTMLTRLLF
jgi:hypothetical protein